MSKRSIEEIKRDIERYREMSAACPHCSYGCYCDGEWSPESRLEGLEKELHEARKADKTPDELIASMRDLRGLGRQADALAMALPDRRSRKK